MGDKLIVGHVPCQETKKPTPAGMGYEEKSGSVLLSHWATPAVPSAQEDLTTLFGMGRGVSPPLWPPEKPNVFNNRIQAHAEVLIQNR